MQQCYLIEWNENESLCYCVIKMYHTYDHISARPPLFIADKWLFWLDNCCKPINDLRNLGLTILHEQKKAG